MLTNQFSNFQRAVYKPKQLGMSIKRKALHVAKRLDVPEFWIEAMMENTKWDAQALEKAFKVGR